MTVMDTREPLTSHATAVLLCRNCGTLICEEPGRPVIRNAQDHWLDEHWDTAPEDLVFTSLERPVTELEQMFNVKAAKR